MKQSILLSMITIIALSLFVVTTQALAGAEASEPRAAGGTPGAPGQGSQNTPGAQATAQAGGHAQPTIYRGTLSAVDASSLTLTLADGSFVTLLLDSETRIKVPGPNAQGDTLVVGMHIVAQARPDANGNLVARSVVAIPGHPSLAHRVGSVTAYAPGSSITIQAVDGQAYTFALTTETQLLPPGLADTLAVDSRVTVIAPRDPSMLGWTATGIVVHPPLP